MTRLLTNRLGNRSDRAPAVEPLEGRVLFAAGDLDRSFSGDGRAVVIGQIHRPAEAVAALLSDAASREAPGAIRMKGPMPCAVSKIAGHFRSQIVMLCNQATPLQRVLAAVRDKGGLAKGERVAVDVDPVSLL